MRRPAAGCSRTPAGSPAARTAGSATSWDRSRPPARPPPGPTCTSSSTRWPRARRLAPRVLWVPALAGATAPEWNADARAGWFGLTAAHGRAHLARALLEGNASRCATCWRRSGPPATHRTSWSAWPAAPAATCCCQIRADVTGLPVYRPDDVETTARGAAMLAAAGRRAAPDVPAASRAMAGQRSEPGTRGRSASEVYDDLYRRHRALYAALRPAVLLTRVPADRPLVAVALPTR